MQRTLPVLALFLISPPHVTVAPIQHTVSVSGIVKNEDDGSPIAGAQVMLAADEDDEAPPAPSNVFTTGPDGRFRIPAPVRASRTWLVAYKHGFPPGESDDVDPKNGGRDIVIVMGKGFEVAGTVCDAAGHPIRGVAVTAQDAGSVLFGTPDPSLSNSEGRFSTLVTEGDWQLTFSREGYLPRIVSMLEVTGAIDAVDIELEPAVAIRGRVVRMDGSGVGGVH